MRYERITVCAQQMGCVPCIRGLLVPVAIIVGMFTEGIAEKDILEAYPDLMVEHIREALMYAAEADREHQIPLLSVA